MTIAVTIYATPEAVGKAKEALKVVSEDSNSPRSGYSRIRSSLDEQATEKTLNQAGFETRFENVRRGGGPLQREMVATLK